MATIATCHCQKQPTYYYENTGSPIATLVYFSQPWLGADKRDSLQPSLCLLLLYKVASDGQQMQPRFIARDCAYIPFVTALPPTSSKPASMFTLYKDIWGTPTCLPLYATSISQRWVTLTMNRSSTTS